MSELRTRSSVHHHKGSISEVLEYYELQYLRTLILVVIRGLQAVFFHELQLQQRFPNNNLNFPLPKFAPTANSITGEVE